MKILVPVKRVPDPTQKTKIKDGAIDLTGASWIVNTFDEYAVETAEIVEATISNQLSRTSYQGMTGIEFMAPLLRPPEAC